MWKTITSVITNIINLLGNVTNSLLNNELFKITIGILILGIIINFIYKLVKKIKTGYAQMDHAIGHNFSAENRKYYVRKAYIDSILHRR